MFSNKLVSTAILAMALLAYSGHTVAQTKAYEEVFQNNKVALEDRGERDTICVIDPVTGDTTKKILPIMYPVSINGTATTAEKSPYRVSAIIQKKITAHFSKTKNLQSIFGETAIPDGVLTLGLANIVVSPDGSVVYYELYKREYYIEKEQVSRKINLKKDIDQVLKDSPTLIKDKFKESYLVLSGIKTKMTFRVHNGVIKR